MIKEKRKRTLIKPDDETPGEIEHNISLFNRSRNKDVI